MGNGNGERLREEKIFINFIKSVTSYGFKLLLQVDAIQNHENQCVTRIHRQK